MREWRRERGENVKWFVEEKQTKEQLNKKEPAEKEHSVKKDKVLQKKWYGKRNWMILWFNYKNENERKGKNLNWKVMERKENRKSDIREEREIYKEADKERDW